MSQATCGIDVGTSGVRAVVALADGTVVGTGSASLRSRRPGDGRHEQDPADWWDALATATRAATAQATSEAGADVVAVALDSTSGTILVQDADGAARGPALMYDDSRAADLAAEADAAGRDLWAALGHAIAPTWALPRLLWLLRHDHVGPTDTVVHQGDHLAGRLVGRPVATDTSQALKTGVDLRAADWSTEVLERLRVPRRVLPDVVLPGTVLGTVDREAAATTGLPEGIEVRAGMTDGCAAQVATGALAPGDWSSALGTTLVLKGATREIVRDPDGAVYCHRHPDGGWLPGGASTSGAGVLGELLPGADLDALTERLLHHGLPGLDQGGLRATYPLVGRGERFPFLSDDAPVTGTPPDDELERFASVCLGLAFVERLAYDVLGGLGADVSGAVTLSGGATRNPWLNQLRADVLGRPTVLTATTEAAFGMAVLAAAEPGGLTATARRMVRSDRRLEPDAARGEALRPAYDAFVDALVEGGRLDHSRLHAGVPTQRGSDA